MVNTFNRKAVIAAIILGPLAIAFTIFIRQHNAFPGDLSVTLFWQSMANSGLTFFMKGLTYIFGDWRAAILTSIIVALTVWRIGKAEAVVVALAGLLSLFSNLFKALIGRPRPAGDLVQILVKESNNSFPSSHAFFSMLLLGAVIYLLNKRMQKRGQKIAISVLLGLLILLVGITRVYLDVHWYSDVIAGYIFGGFFLTLLIIGYERWNNQRKIQNSK